MLGNILRSIRYKGLVGTVLHGYNELLFDWRWGVRTTGVIDQREVLLDRERGVTGERYQPASHYLLKRLFPRLHPERTGGVLVDYGCGKGRVALFASDYPFRRIVGVEYSEELYRTCLDNLARCRARTGRGLDNVEIVLADAGDWPLPDDADLLFLFNPFQAPVLERVLGAVEASLARRPRRITAAYVVPLHQHLFAEAGWTTLWKDKVLSFHVSVFEREEA